MEEELAKHLKQLADQFHGLAPVKCRELASEYAEKNNIPVPANWTEKQCAEVPNTSITIYRSTAKEVWVDRTGQEAVMRTLRPK
ncbi:unnamed protein product [Pleuronectes platessa]|uniref:Uncharacterized protein n=1 Tax=Pleuronectes platessa TaxID=8262 RepID=A0A9N7V712_PLEPL|nr:unnamed protein product [Pleuronectes platessa]